MTLVSKDFIIIGLSCLVFRYEPVLVQEMLALLIQILQERRFCGLSTAENLRREIIFKLATGDFTHSQLVKSLPRDLSKSDELQGVLDDVSVYCNPSGMNQVLILTQMLASPLS